MKVLEPYEWIELIEVELQRIEMRDTKKKMTRELSDSHKKHTILVMCGDLQCRVTTEFYEC